MGSTTVIRSTSACSEEALQDWFLETCAEMLQDSGSGPYCGNWNSNTGLHITGQVFKTESEAVNYIEENANKRDDILAVRVGDFTKTFPETKAQKALVEKAKLLQKEFDEFDRNIMVRAQAAKSKTKKCTHCESNINVKKLQVPSVEDLRKAGRADCGSVVRHGSTLFLVEFRQLCACPVCGQNLLVTDTDTKNKASLRTRLTEVLQKVRLEEEAYRRQKLGQPRASWVVGGVCGC